MKKLIIASVASVLLMGCNEKKVEYFEDGKTVRLEYEVNGDGEVDGPFKQYYRNGNVEISAKYDEGIPTGDVTIFDENGAVKSKVTYKPDYKNLLQETFTDPRDNKVYPITKIGKQIWLAQNLNYEMDGSYCFEKNGFSCTGGYVEYGRHYTKDAALKACPEGWHLPNNDEWNELIEYVGGVSEQLVLERLLDTRDLDGDCSTSYETKKTTCVLNPYGFNLLSAGNFENGKYDEAGISLWSSTEPPNAKYADLFFAFPSFLRDENAEKYDLHMGGVELNEKPALSVRCIKGEPNYALEGNATSGVESVVPNKDVGEEIISNFNMYTKLQDACFENDGEICSLVRTGFTLPSSKTFKYGEINKPKGIYAATKTTQGSCPKGVNGKSMLKKVVML